VFKLVQRFGSLLRFCLQVKWKEAPNHVDTLETATLFRWMPEWSTVVDKIWSRIHALSGSFDYGTHWV